MGPNANRPTIKGMKIMKKKNVLVIFFSGYKGD